MDLKQQYAQKLISLDSVLEKVKSDDIILIICYGGTFYGFKAAICSKTNEFR